MIFIIEDDFIFKKQMKQQFNESNSRKKTTEQFVAEFKAIFGDKYDTSEVVYNGAMQKVKMICPEHGEFWIKPHCALSQKRACQKCGMEQARMKIRRKQEDVIEAIKKIHGDKYDLSEVEYNGMCEKIKLI